MASTPRTDRVLSDGVRARVTLTLFDGQPAVRKEFRTGCERFLEREIFARAELSQVFPVIPPLLEHKGRYVISPFYEDVLEYRRTEYRLFPVPVATQVIEFLEALYNHGFALLDAHPENVLLESTGQLRIVDFEFLHRYGARKPSSFLESWDLVGPPEGWSGDRPRGGCPTWKAHWYPYVGLSVQELRSLDPSRKLLRRIAHWISWLLPRRIDQRLTPEGRQVKHRVASLARRGVKWPGRDESDAHGERLAEPPDSENPR